MSQTQKQIILSLSDILKEIKHKRLLLYLSGALFAFLAFGYVLTRPITFTAEGIFKGHNAPTTTNLVKALEFLEGSESYASPDDPRTFLKSYPVLLRVVKELNLQATVVEKKFGERLKTIWETYQTEKAYHRLAKKRPQGRILHKKVAVPTGLMIPDKTSSVTCSSLLFDQELAATLKITFQDDLNYTIWDKKQKLGSGSIDTPFVWEKGTFILSGNGKKKKTYFLSLLPLEQTIESVRSSLTVQKQKENPQLFTLSFTHTDRHLAAAIVNEAMHQFELYLKDEGKKKINHQLDYLTQRQYETMGQLETIMENHRAYLESHLDSGEMITLEKELEYMAQRQSQKKQELQKIIGEMQHLAAISLPKKKRIFSELLEELQKNRPQHPVHSLTIDTAHSLLYQHQHQLDSLRLEDEKFDVCLTNLLGNDVQSASLSKTIGDPSVNSRFEKIHTLNHRLLDEKNWTEKEREQMREEITTEKQFIIKHIKNLKEGVFLQKKAVQTRMQMLHENLLYLLYDAYLETQASLEELVHQAAHFPKKWLTEQKIELNTKLFSEIMESITKLIEAKNINYHLDYLMASQLKTASSPVLPNHPHLILKTFLSSLAGVLFIFLALCTIEVWQGPSASFTNLCQQNRFVADPKQTINTLGYALLQKGKRVLITAQIKPTIIADLANWLEKRGETVSIQKYSPKNPLNPKDIEQLKSSYDRMILQFTGSPESVETSYLCTLVDTTIFGIQNERLHELEKLPESTLFYFENQKLKSLTLKEIRPFLSNLLARFTHLSTTLKKKLASINLDL